MNKDTLDKLEPVIFPALKPLAGSAIPTQSNLSVSDSSVVIAPKVNVVEEIKSAPVAVPNPIPVADKVVPAPPKPAPKVAPNLIPAKETAPPRSTVRPPKKRLFRRVSFFLMVLLPTLFVTGYYAQLASDQYRSEMRFAVRGTTRSPLDFLGLAALPGGTSQGADAYIVIEYMKSIQMLIDIREQLGIDLRQYFSKPEIDLLYRVDKDIPLEKFVNYWDWMIAADYNSTTSIATFRVNAFSSEDAAKISEAVLNAASKLVNDLSTDARNTLIESARNEVTRTELRLAEARNAVGLFRNKEQSLDPTQQAASGQELITGLQKELLDLKARRSALRSTITETSPSVRVLDRQIAALESELRQQRQEFGSGQDLNTDERNLSDVLNDYSRLKLEEEFSEKAYTSALSSLETSLAEARRQERYFAVLVKPTLPDFALFPMRILNTLIAFSLLIVAWLIFYLGVQAIRDHAV